MTLPIIKYPSGLGRILTAFPLKMTFPRCLTVSEHSLNRKCPETRTPETRHLPAKPKRIVSVDPFESDENRIKGIGKVTRWDDDKHTTSGNEQTCGISREQPRRSRHA